MPKMAAPTSSLRTPKMRRPSNLVRSTTTSSGTRKMRPRVRAFGRFMRCSSRAGRASRYRIPRSSRAGGNFGITAALRVSSGIAMKAILLAGGKGTRLRPLTVHTPKPIVPIFNRPFLYYQIDLLRQVPEIDEVILSLNYQPRRIEEIFGDGEGLGIKLRYVVEPMPLGTGGAIRYAGDSLTESVVVFNGDVLSQVDLGAVLRLHRERKAKATIVLTPVDNPRAYGLVETDEHR